VSGASRPRLAELGLADPPERWEALSFAVRDASVRLGGVVLRLGAAGEGIVSWALSGIAPGITDLDGLPTSVIEPPLAEPGSSEHPNGGVALDHVVVLTPDFERTSGALERAGMPLRRTNLVDAGAARVGAAGCPAGGKPAAGGFRQGFRRLGPAILELVEARDAPPGPARFWGLVVIVEDLDALTTRLGDLVGQIKPAVQPGRRIATLRASAGLSSALAFMTPEPPG